VVGGYSNESNESSIHSGGISLTYEIQDSIHSGSLREHFLLSALLLLVL
jgi:hypothetical protein